MNNYENPEYWLKSTLQYLSDANREAASAAESFLKAVTFGAEEYDIGGTSVDIKETFLKCIGTIFDATGYVSALLRTAQRENKRENGEENNG